jgi:hypothetical protein
MVYTADGVETLHVHTLLLIMLNFLYDVEKSYVNVGTPECRKIVSLASTFFTGSQLRQSGLACRHQGQSSTTSHRVSPALPMLFLLRKTYRLPPESVVCSTLFIHPKTTHSIKTKLKMCE